MNEMKDHAMRNPEYRDWFFNNMEQKTGVRYPVASEKSRKKANEVLNDKTISTMTEMLDEMGYDFISRDRQDRMNDMFTYRCRRCGEEYTLNKTTIYQRHKRHKYEMCPKCDNFKMMVRRKSEDMPVRVQSFDGLMGRYMSGDMTQRQLITYAKSDFSNTVMERTGFLDTDDIVERLWYIVNDVKEPLMCPYCGKKRLKFTGRLNEGFVAYCNDPKCKTEHHRKTSSGRKVHQPKVVPYIEWQNTVTMADLNDDVIVDKLFGGQGLIQDLVEVIDGVVKEYILDRFDDSDSIIETLQRMKNKIYEKPKCPVCGNPVNYIGKPNRMFTEYCSSSCWSKTDAHYKQSVQVFVENQKELLNARINEMNLQLRWDDGDKLGKIGLTCLRCGKEFTLRRPYFHLYYRYDMKHVCPVCDYKELKFRSKQEREIYKVVLDILDDKSIDVERNIYVNGAEIDISVPSMKIGIEHNGLYYHSDAVRKDGDPYRHQNKKRLIESEGYRLINIWEDEWQNKKDVIKSMLKVALGKGVKWKDLLYPAKDVDRETAEQFYTDNSLYDYPQGGQNSIGVYVRNDLKMVMTYNINNGVCTVLGVCEKQGETVINGWSILMNMILSKENDITEFRYTPRLEWEPFDLKKYRKMGFEVIATVEPEKWWIDGFSRDINYIVDRAYVDPNGEYPIDMSDEEVIRKRYDLLYGLGGFVMRRKV